MNRADAALDSAPALPLPSSPDRGHEAGDPAMQPLAIAGVAPAASPALSGASAASTPSTAIPQPVQSLLQLFCDQLARVKFPDVDAAVLTTAAAEVRALADEVSRAEATLEAARAALEGGQEALLARAQRALAYARVFAEDDPALGARLDEIVLPRPSRRAPRAEASAASATPIEAPRRRGRPRKDGPADPLFSVPSEGAPHAEAASSG